MSIGTIIAQRIELQFEKRENNKEIEQLKEKANSLELRTPLVEEEEKQGSGNVAFAVIHSAITIWQGMAEALDIISKFVLIISFAYFIRRRIYKYYKWYCLS